MSIGINLAEQGLLPDFMIKHGINKLLEQRLAEMPADAGSEQYRNQLITELKNTPIAIATDAANEQHYEVPADFYKIALGKHLKYSSCYYENGAQDLDTAEEHMLQLYGQRAEIKDGMEILDLGCGWGSFSLWAGGQFPNARIQAVSNSASQKEFIDAEAKRRGIANLTVHTADINHFKLEHKFDRIVSVEMFEHMRNYRELFAKVAGWLKDDGRAFVHIFCHKKNPYYFETEGDDNWMGKYFFTGGIMPSEDLFAEFDEHLQIDRQWRVNGKNYEQTALHWLENIDQRKDEVIDIMARTYGQAEAKRWYHRWRIFFLSCAGLWGFRNGEEWWVSHYLFSKRALDA